MVEARTRTRDPKGTRRAIFKAAVTIFADKGFAGTSIRDLSRASGVSTGLILHHFGSKEQLYEAVKRSAYARLLQTLAEEGPSGIKGDILDQVRTGFYRARGNQTMQRIGLWARLEGDKAPWPGEEELVSGIRRWIAYQQRTGALRPDIKPLFLLIMISELNKAWWFYKERYWRLLGRSSDDLQTDPELDEAYLHQLLDILARGTGVHCCQPDASAAVRHRKGKGT